MMGGPDHCEVTRSSRRKKNGTRLLTLFLGGVFLWWEWHRGAPSLLHGLARVLREVGQLVEHRLRPDQRVDQVRVT